MLLVHNGQFGGNYNIRCGKAFEFSCLKLYYKRKCLKDFETIKVFLISIYLKPHVLQDRAKKVHSTLLWSETDKLNVGKSKQYN